MAKQQLFNLRRRYARYKDKLKCAAKSGSGTSSVPREFVFAAKLQFLDPTLVRRMYEYLMFIILTAHFIMLYFYFSTTDSLGPCRDSESCIEKPVPFDIEMPASPSFDNLDSPASPSYERVESLSIVPASMSSVLPSPEAETHSASPVFHTSSPVPSTSSSPVPSASCLHIPTTSSRLQNSLQASRMRMSMLAEGKNVFSVVLDTTQKMRAGLATDDIQHKKTHLEHFTSFMAENISDWPLYKQKLFMDRVLELYLELR